MRVFVYGTLKAGQRNAHLLGRPSALEPATVIGRLHEHPEGYPVLLVPAGLALARATGDVARDAARQEAEPPLEPPPPPGPGWRVIQGELVTLAAPATQLPVLDELEGVVAGRAEGDYERVLVPVQAGERVVAAWAWVARGGRIDAAWAPVAGARWPAAAAGPRTGR